MGTQEERDWVDAANDLLSKCHINLRLKKLTDCDAGVFVALYEAILGDKVPDYIAAPRSQEDDAHNVQSVIDSLALDYLQISLSHITGENVVRGDKESVRNLLEIFDGLLEYLTEQTSEEDSQTSDEPDCVSDEAPSPAQEPPLERLADEREALSEFRPPSSRGSTAQSSQYSGPLWDMEGSESTAELIRLGDSARTFTAKSQAGRNGSPPCTEPPNGIHRTGNSCTGTGASHHRDHAVEPVSLPAAPVSLYVPHGPATQLREPLRPATLLQPPYQPAQPPTEGLADVLMDRSLPASASGQRGEEVPVPRTGSPSPRQLSDTPALNGLRSPCHSPVESEKSESSSSTSASRKKKTSTSTELELPESGATGSKRVAFRTQPDIRLLTLQSEQEGLADWGSGEEEEEEEEAGSGQQGRARQQNLRGPGDQTSLSEGKLSGASPGEEPLSWRRLKNRQKEQELQEMSDKLSRRLEELHVMLQQALGEGAETSETREEDKLSHHSDSFMECRRTKRQTGPPHPAKPPRTRSLSPSPPPARRHLQVQFEEPLTRDAQGRHLARVRRHTRAELDSCRRKGQVVGRAYQEELRQYEDRERIHIAKETAKAMETEKEYKEALQKDTPSTQKPSRIYSSKSAPPTPRAGPHTPSRGRVHPRKPTPMRIRDNDLLPQLLEDLPGLQLSPHTLNRMWKQQLRQVGNVAPPLSGRGRKQLDSQVEEAQRKHDLLVEIIRKEQEHNQRLREFQDRIRLQKSAQTRLRDQRQQVARARKYYTEHHVQLRARRMRARTREERMVRQLFEEGLELQKQRLLEIRADAKEQRQEHRRRHRDELQAMENYYKDQFSLLAETLAQERQEIQVRKKAQEKALQKMKKELRSKMQREIGELQQIILQNDRDDFSCEREVERLQQRIHTASFQYSAGHLL